jgi:hypothetical protein
MPCMHRSDPQVVMKPLSDGDGIEVDASVGAGVAARVGDGIVVEVDGEADEFDVGGGLRTGVGVGVGVGISVVLVIVVGVARRGDSALTCGAALWLTRTALRLTEATPSAPRHTAMATRNMAIRRGMRPDTWDPHSGPREHHPGQLPLREALALASPPRGGPALVGSQSRVCF